MSHIPENLVKDLAEAMRPILISVEEPSCHVENTKVLERAAISAWLSFANRAYTWIEPKNNNNFY